MTAFTASAPGKAILFGEHAVVYGFPAIAIPVTQVKAKAYVFPLPLHPRGEVKVEAPDIGLDERLVNLPENQPVRLLLSLLADELQLKEFPAFHLKIVSTIPLAAGLGSGAAISVAIIRAVAAFLGKHLSDEKTSALAYEIEKIYHGNPSGIDNTVITFSRPLYFVRGHPFELLRTREPLTFVLADTGVKSSTGAVVGQVRSAWLQDQTSYDKIFKQIGEITCQGRRALEQGQASELGALMNRNHELLKQIHVSCPELENLVSAALKAGAGGAKISGAGQGGNIIALLSPDQVQPVTAALQKAGAVRTILTHLSPGD